MMLVPRVNGNVPVLRSQWNLDRLFNDFFADWPLSHSASRAYPALNAWEDEKHVYVEAEVPGLSQDDLEINFVDNELVISGGREDKVEDGKTFHRSERFYGKFSRSVRFGVDIDPDKVEASLENGVLTVKLQKADVALPRKIKVKGQ
jgi:HSP20 family protein